MEESVILQGRTLEVTAPSGYKYELREQTGEDDDIISNPVAAKDLTNLSRFIQGVVIKTDRTKSGRLTLEDVKNLPLNDKYFLLLASRKHSLGDIVDFTYDWGEDFGGKKEYEQDLTELMFDDYGVTPDEEELNSKPFAVPYYPGDIEKDIRVNLTSGKTVVFDLMDGNGEAYLLNLPVEERTKNKELIARNLRLEVDGKFEQVKNFKLFTPKDMVEMRKAVAENDPIFTGNIEIENPTTSQVLQLNIIAVPGFFFPGEV